MGEVEGVGGKEGSIPEGGKLSQWEEGSLRPEQGAGEMASVGIYNEKFP